ncbi:MAG: FxsA family protein [Pseudomonadota bacterium]
MARGFFITFLLMPIIEIALLIQVGSLIGVLWTVLLIVLTAIVGTLLLRAQGLSVLLRSRSAMAEGRIPASEMAEGVALAVGGALLLTPGFVTDAIGFCLLVPTTRRALVSWVSKRVVVHTAAAGPTPAGTQNGRGPSPHAPIEGEFSRDD